MINYIEIIENSTFDEIIKTSLKRLLRDIHNEFIRESYTNDTLQKKASMILGYDFFEDCINSINLDTLDNILSVVTIQIFSKINDKSGKNILKMMEDDEYWSDIFWLSDFPIYDMKDWEEIHSAFRKDPNLSILDNKQLCRIVTWMPCDSFNKNPLIETLEIDGRTYIKKLNEVIDEIDEMKDIDLIYIPPPINIDWNKIGFCEMLAKGNILNWYVLTYDDINQWVKMSEIANNDDYQT